MGGGTSARAHGGERVGELCGGEPIEYHICIRTASLGSRHRPGYFWDACLKAAVEWGLSTAEQRRSPSPLLMGLIMGFIVVGVGGGSGLGGCDSHQRILSSTTCA